MRLLHTSDVHLGRAFGYLGERAYEHQERLKRAFQRIFTLARQHECQAVLIAGDLFDNPRVSQSWVNFALATMSDSQIPTIVIPGNHDPAERHPFLEARLPSNLLTIMEPSTRRVPGLDLEIMACPAGFERYLAGLFRRNPNGAPCQVGLVHGSMPTAGGTGTLDPQGIAQSGLDYVALGDWHSPQDFSMGGVVCWYSGAPEMIMPDQRLPGVVLVVELGQGGPARVERIPSGEATYPEGTNGTLEIDVAEFEDALSLREALRARLHPSTVARVRLVGRWQGETPLNVYDLAENLHNSCLWLEFESAYQHETFSPSTPFEQVLAALVEEQGREGTEDTERLQEAYQLALYLLRGGRL